MSPPDFANYFHYSKSRRKLQGIRPVFSMDVFPKKRAEFPGSLVEFSKDLWYTEKGRNLL